MTLNKEIFGKKIRQIRIEKGLSQEQLSEKIEISPRHMCTIENGNSLPSIDTFLKIAKVLDININDFFNLNIKTKNNIRHEVYNMIQASSASELNLIKDIIEVIQKNYKKK